MTVYEMKARIKELGYSYGKIAELAGLPVETVREALDGVTEPPRYDTLAALEEVFRKPAEVRESPSAYGSAGEKVSVREYRMLPDDQRAELIDGVLYDMAAPTSAHQITAGLLHAELLRFVTERGGTCVPIISPVDVQLDEDDWTMVQPDVLVVCDRGKIRNECVFGAPDLVIEILSPSTRKKDTELKFHKYMCAGVREYWIVDLERRRVTVCDFMGDPATVLYGAKQEVPVRIFRGECRISLREIFQYLDRLYERP